jgi:hypothetical protein
MPKSIFDRIMDWPYHPPLIMTLAFVGGFTAAMQGGGPLWAGLIAAAFMAPFAALILFLPYLFAVTLLAFVLSLSSLIRATLSILHKSAPATH